MSWLGIAVIVVAVAAAVATSATYLLTGVPALPTSPRVLGPLLVLADRVPRREIVDLGSGWGTLVAAMAQRHPRASVVGYEVSPLPYLFSRARLWLLRLPNAAVRYGNLHDADLATADLVLCYLTRRPMQRLRDKLERELPANAELVCHTFAMQGWEPVETLRATDLYRTPVYRYARPRPAAARVRHPWMERPRRPGAEAAGLLEAPQPEADPDGAEP